MSERSSRLCLVSANFIVSQLGRTEHTASGAAILPGLSPRSCPTYGRSQHSNSDPFRPEELESLRVWIPSSRSLCSTLGRLSHLGFAISSVLTSCTSQLKIPKILRRTLIVAVPKPDKPLGTQRALTYISAVCSLSNPRETHLRPVEQIIDPLLPQEQAGFRHGSTVDQGTLLT